MIIKIKTNYLVLLIMKFFIVSIVIKLIIFVVFIAGSHLYLTELFKPTPQHVFLKNIDFSKGEYALVVQRNHLTPQLLVDDAAELQANKDSIQTKKIHSSALYPAKVGMVNYEPRSCITPLCGDEYTLRHFELNKN